VLAEELTNAVLHGVRHPYNAYFTPSILPEPIARQGVVYPEREATQITVNELLRRASLPPESYLCAVAILRRLGDVFFCAWSKMLVDEKFYEPPDPITKELVILTAIVNTSNGLQLIC
jgi:hypothetical protein